MSEECKCGEHAGHIKSLQELTEEHKKNFNVVDLLSLSENQKLIKSIPVLKERQYWMIAIFVCVVAILTFIYTKQLLPFMEQAPKDKAAIIENQTKNKLEILEKIHDLQLQNQKTRIINTYTPQDNVDYFSMKLKQAKRNKKLENKKNEEEGL